MSAEIHLSRGRLLLEQHRPEMAVDEFRQALALEPQDAEAHSLLALALTRLDRSSQAQESAERACGLAPDWAFTHYVLSVVLGQREQYAGAMDSIRVAISLDPTDPAYHAQEAQLHINRKDWRDALASSEVGLQYDPGDVDCINLRAIAMTHLGDRDAAGEAIESALRQAPEDATSHANMGWTMLHDGQPDKAAEHFREALRLDPDHEWARSGIVEALKARHFIYRWFLRYVLWLSGLKKSVQIGLFVGVIVPLQLLVRLPSQGVIKNIGIALAFCYFIFIVTVWTAYPLFNLLLRLNRFGRLTLGDAERRDSTWFGVALLVVAALLSGPLIYGYRHDDLIHFLFLLLPTGVFLTALAGQRRLLGVGTLLMFAVAIVYWFRMYPLIPFDLPAVKELAAEVMRLKKVIPVPAEISGGMTIAEMAHYIRTQNVLQNIFCYGSALMTWLGALR